MGDNARETFIAEFGEGQADAIEAAVAGHLDQDAAVSGGLHPHARDNYGSQPFRYVFLYAIGRECVTRFAGDHGVTADVDAMRAWATDPERGNLGGHDGDIPDYLALLGGAYAGWVAEVAS